MITQENQIRKKPREDLTQLSSRENRSIMKELILITLSVYEGKHLQISQKIHTHNILTTSKMWLGYFFLYLKQNIKSYTSYGLGLSWKFCRKNNLYEVRLIESYFRSIEPCRFNPIILQPLDSNFTHKHTLSNLNLDSKF